MMNELRLERELNIGLKYDIIDLAWDDVDEDDEERINEGWC